MRERAVQSRSRSMSRRARAVGLRFRRYGREHSGFAMRLAQSLPERTGGLDGYPPFDPTGRARNAGTPRRIPGWLREREKQSRALFTGLFSCEVYG